MVIVPVNHLMLVINNSPMANIHDLVHPSVTFSGQRLPPTNSTAADMARPAHLKHWTNADLMLVHRLRRWLNNKSALVQRLDVFAAR